MKMQLSLASCYRRGLNLKENAGESPVTMSTGAAALLAELGEPVFRFFMTQDADRDGFLNPSEFLGFYHLLSPIQVSFPSIQVLFEDQ